MYKNIRPGKVWYDTNGKRIQAHGGSILYAEGKYWWYGENKEGIRGMATGEKCAFWHHGVKLYSSTDLYNWQDEGFVVKESDNPENPFYPKNLMDRPHILYNEKTKKYVLWAKTSVGTFDECNFSVCVGESLNHLRYVKDVRYKDITVGDFDIFTVDGKGYIVYEHPHEYMVLQELTDDYQDLSPTYSAHLHLESPPYVREAPAHFERNGRHFLLTSGTSGYYPNETICYDITDLHGEWKDLGKPCVNDEQKNSFHAQYSSVFQHPTRKDLYIALGDRWLTDISIDMPDIEKVILGIFEKEGGIKVEDLSVYSDENTEEANYVWLPIKFKEDGTPYIVWLNRWDTENF